MRGRLTSIFGAALVAAVVLLVPAAAVQADGSEAPQTQLLSVKGTGGYTLGLLAQVPSAGAPAEEQGVGLFVQSQHAGVSYAVDATLTPTKIEADLGSLGRIDVTRVATGRYRSVAGNCGKSNNKSTKARVEIDRYEGTIEFHGEEGFTEVDATHARGVSGSFFCGYPEGGRPAGAQLPGARLAAERQAGGERTTFTATQNRPGAKTYVGAELEEHKGEMEIHRAVGFWTAAGAGVLDYDRGLHGATVKPPAPFSGWGRFKARPGAGELEAGHWSGNLAVDLPGHAGVALGGPGFRATLWHTTR